MPAHRAVPIDQQAALQRELENDIDQRIREDISFGVEAKKFLTSHLAQYITDSAEDKVLAAQNALATVDPTNVKEIVKQQAIIARYDHFFGCLQEIVAAGETAYQVYLEDHHENN